VVEPPSQKRARELRETLAHVLDEARQRQETLIQLVRDPSVPVPELFAEINALERLDERRDELAVNLLRAAGRERRRVEGRTVRATLLRALEQIGHPQKAAFLADYVWARDQVPIETRAFGSLRRDERRAWQAAKRRPRLAYITPALDSSGAAAKGWLSRSDWPLQRRIVTAHSSTLFELQRLASLLDAPGSRADDILDPLDTLLETCARETLDIELPSWEEPGARSRWVETLRRRLAREITALRPQAETEQLDAATVLARRLVEEQLWGTA
jgi:hypothetical protein